MRAASAQSDSCGLSKLSLAALASMAIREFAIVPQRCSKGKSGRTPEATSLKIDSRYRRFAVALASGVVLIFLLSHPLPQQFVAMLLYSLCELLKIPSATEALQRDAAGQLRTAAAPFWAFFLERYLMPVLFQLIGVSVAFLVLHRLTTTAIGGDGPRCKKCGYLLRGVSKPRCPECGRPI